MQCWPPAENCLAVSEKDLKFKFFSKYSFFNFSQNDPMDTKNAVITTSPKNFWRKGENFCRSVQKR